MFFLFPIVGWAAAAIAGAAAVAAIAGEENDSNGRGSSSPSETEILERERERKRRRFRESMTLEAYQQLKIFVRSHPDLITINQAIYKPSFSKLKKFSSKWWDIGSDLPGFLKAVRDGKCSFSLQGFTNGVFGFHGTTDPFLRLKYLIPQLEISSSWKNTAKEVEEIKEEIALLKQMMTIIEKDGGLSE